MRTPKRGVTRKTEFFAETDLRAGVATPLAKLVGTYVMVKQNGEWLISAARIARAMP